MFLIQTSPQSLKGVNTPEALNLRSLCVFLAISLQKWQADPAAMDAKLSKRQATPSNTLTLNIHTPRHHPYCSRTARQQAERHKVGRRPQDSQTREDLLHVLQYWNRRQGLQLHEGPTRRPCQRRNSGGYNRPNARRTVRCPLPHPRST